MGSEEVAFLLIGVIAGPRGVLGEIKVNIETEEPERFRQLDHVLLGEQKVRHGVSRARLHKGQALLTLEGIASREAAEPLRGMGVYVGIEDALPLGEDEYYTFQLEGMAVVDEAGEPLGKLDEVLVTGANDVYVVRSDQGELLLPAIRDVILAIDVDAQRITVRVPDGLL